MGQEQVLVELVEVEVLVVIELLVMAHHHYEDLHNHKRHVEHTQLQLEQEHLVITHHTLQEVLVQTLQEKVTIHQ